MSSKKACKAKSLLRPIYIFYFIVVALPLFILTTIIASLVAMTACYLGMRKFAAMHPGKLWSRISLALFLCPVKIVGKEHINSNELPAVVMANHQSSFDILVMYGYLGIPFRWVMKKTLRKVPFIGPTCAKLGCIFVDEKDRNSIKNTLESGKKQLKEGNSIFIFPEGHRTLTGKMLRFKKGGFLMAYELNKPIIPVSIDGAFDVLPKGKYIPSPRELVLTIHQPVYIDSSLEMPVCINEAVRKTFDVINSALSE